MPYENTYLAHYGIKGQKWGLRRFQNEDGTLTEEGMRRYGITNSDGKLNISDNVKYNYKSDKINNINYYAQIQNEKRNRTDIGDRRRKLEKKYIDEGLTKEQAEVEALKRYKIEKTIKIAGAIALTAAIAYGAYKGHKFIQRYADKTIRKGSQIIRTTGNNVINDHDAYVTTKARDAVKYKGLYGTQIKMRQEQERILNGIAPNGVYNIKGSATKKMKIAGTRNATKVFEDLMKKDPQFAKNVSDAISKNDATHKLYIRDWDKHTLYEKFNTLFTDRDDPTTSNAVKRFYEALKSKGYSGVTDVNDKLYSGYNAKNPVILFNLRNKITNVKISKLSNSVIEECHEKAQKMIIREELIKVKAKQVVGKSVIYGSTVSSAGILSNLINANRVQNNSIKYRTIIKQYKKEHPNTQLSDDEILNNLLG